MANVRLVIFLAALASSALLFACGGGGDDDDSSAAPLDTATWETFEAPSGCLSVSHPGDWDLQVRGDLDGEGEESCPGGSETDNLVAECVPGTTGQIIGLTRVQIGGDDEPIGGWVELHAANARCETVEDEIRVIIESSDGSLESAGGGEIAGNPALCGAGQREFEGATLEVRVCASEIEGGIYLLTTTWDTARSVELQATAEAIAASLAIDPIGE